MSDPSRIGEDYESNGFHENRRNGPRSRLIFPSLSYGNSSSYFSFSSFVRLAPQHEIDSLWASTANDYLHQISLSSGLVWLSSSQTYNSLFCFRIDFDSRKTKYVPYRQAPSVSSPKDSFRIQQEATSEVVLKSRPIESHQSGLLYEGFYNDSFGSKKGSDLSIREWALLMSGDSAKSRLVRKQLTDIVKVWLRM